MTPPESQHTSWYGLYNGNISLMYSPAHDLGVSHLQQGAVRLAQANDGAVGALNVPPTSQLRQDTLLEEAGVKFDLLGKALFISIAGFKQDRQVSTGPSQLDESLAHITGAEFELNYQPSPRLFATASYSYLHTRLIRRRGSTIFRHSRGLTSTAPARRWSFAPSQSFDDPGCTEAPDQLPGQLQARQSASGSRLTFR